MRLSSFRLNARQLTVLMHGTINGFSIKRRSKEDHNSLKLLIEYILKCIIQQTLAPPVGRASTRQCTIQNTVHIHPTKQKNNKILKKNYIQSITNITLRPHTKRKLDSILNTRIFSN